MRLAGALALVLLLGGCGLPPAYTLASYVVDGLVLVATGKTTTDHGLSVAMGRDCALWRAVDGRDVCENPQSVAASADPVIEAAARRALLAPPTLPAGAAPPGSALGLKWSAGLSRNVLATPSFDAAAPRVAGLRACPVRTNSHARRDNRTAGRIGGGGSSS